MEHIPVVPKLPLCSAYIFLFQSGRQLQHFQPGSLVQIRQLIGFHGICRAEQASIYCLAGFGDTNIACFAYDMHGLFAATRGVQFSTI